MATQLNLAGTLFSLWLIARFVWAALERLTAWRRHSVRLLLAQGLLGTWTPGLLPRPTRADALAVAGEGLGPTVTDLAREWLAPRPLGVLAVAVVGADGACAGLLANPGGERLLSGGTATRFEIGSVSKTMTAVLTADCVERGLLALDTPVGRVLGAQLAGAGDGSAITIGELLTHGSGLPRLDPAFVLRTRLVGPPLDPYRPYSTEQLLAFLRRWRRPARVTPQYSNLGIDLLGVVLAPLLGLPLAEAFRTRLWDPLGMADTYLNTGATDSPRLIPGFSRSGTPSPPWTSPLGAAGGVHSTIEDMGRFVAAARPGGQTPLARAMARSGTPLAPFPSNPGSGRSIAMCWIREADGLAWHNGMTGGYSSFIGLTPRGAGLVILSNYACAVDALGRTVALAIDQRAPAG